MWSMFAYGRPGHAMSFQDDPAVGKRSQCGGRLCLTLGTPLPSVRLTPEALRLLPATPRDVAC